MNQELANQLYKGEKARNQVLNKQVSDLKLQLSTFGIEINEARKMKIENDQYRQLILKYED